MMKLDMPITTIKGEPGKEVDGTPFTLRGALLTLLGLFRPSQPKEPFYVWAIAGKIRDEKVVEFEPSVREIDLLRKIAKANAGANGEPIYPVYTQAQILLALGLTEDDV